MKKNKNDKSIEMLVILDNENPNEKDFKLALINSVFLKINEIKNSKKWDLGNVDLYV